MGYRIEYCSKKLEDRPSAVLPMTFGAFILFCLLLQLFWPEGERILWELIWPGEAASTRQAVEVLVQQLRWGEPLSDALETFCVTVLHGS